MRIFQDTKRHAMIQRLEPIWTKLGHTLSKDPADCDVQLCFIHIRTKTNLPIVLRLDGVYYDKAINFKAKNRAISKAHRHAKGIIYQSTISKEICERYLAKRTTENYVTVFNGIEENWGGDAESHEGINIVTTAKWRRWKRLQETINLFLTFLKFCPNSKLHILGRLYGNKKTIHPKIFYYGQVGFDKMKSIYKTADMFIHIARNDWCPKTVTEAIGSGIPVITTDGTGGSAEMCRITSGCIVVPGDKNSVQPDYPYQDPFNSISAVVKKRLRKAMVQIAKDKRRVLLPKEMNIEYVAQKYLEVLQNACKNKGK